MIPFLTQYKLFTSQQIRCSSPFSLSLLYNSPLIGCCAVGNANLD